MIFKNLLQTAKYYNVLRFLYTLLRFLYIFTESKVATTVQLNNLNSFCKLHNPMIFKNLLQTQIHYNVLYFSSTLLRFLYIFAKSCVAVTAFQFVGKLTQKCLF